MDSHSSFRTSGTLLGRLHRRPTDPEAWGEFVRRYGKRIFLWCRRWNLQEADAEDVTQNVLAEIARQMKTFAYDPSRSFRGWLKTLTHAAWHNFVNSRQFRERGSGDSQMLELLHSAQARQDLASAMEEQFDLELLEEALWRVRLRVAPPSWEAFRLLASDELSGADVAQRLGMKVGAVYMAKCRVQKLIREELQILEAESER